MNILIVDDEAPARDRLRQLLEEDGTHTVVGEAGNGKRALELAAELEPDVVLLDIRMPGLGGIETAHHLNTFENPPAIIFATAYDEYALQAFKLNSIDYLLKPIDDEDLAVAVNKYTERLPKQKAVTLDFNDIKKLLVNPTDREYKKRFSVKVGQHLKLINIDNSECF